MTVQYHSVELPSGLKVEARAQSWPEFANEMDARMEALERLSAASPGDERSKIEIELTALGWRSRRDKIRACLKNPKHEELMSAADALALTEFIDTLGRQELERKNSKSGGDGSATRGARNTAPAA